MNDGLDSDLRIRRAIGTDVEALHELAQTVAALPLLQRYGARADRLAQDLVALAGLQCDDASPPHGEQLWLAEAISGSAADASQRLVGFARVLLGSDRASGHFGRGGYLRLIALRPGHSGRGVGARLLTAVEQAVLARHSDLFLLTSDFNHGAQRFYERAGYVRVGALPDFVSAGITELLYWKRLLSPSPPPHAGAAQGIEPCS